MKLILNILYFGILSAVLPFNTDALPRPLAMTRGGTTAAASGAFDEHKESSGTHNQIFLRSDGHRHLKGKGESKYTKMKGKGKGGKFVCPDNSAPIAGREVKSMNDCDCDVGYFQEGTSCVAEQGRCTHEYALEVEEKIGKVEFWISMAEAETEETRESKETQLEYVDKMNTALQDAWIAYTIGNASCAMWGTDDLVALEEFEAGGRRLLDESHRELFFRRLARAIKRVVKKAVQVVVKAVETVVDVVVELVECGVGIVKDGPKCGLVGCAFGLVGVALNVAFTLATGGANKFAAAACDVADLAEDGDDDGDEKNKKNEIAVTILNGIGDTVCAVNEKINSAVLTKVCDLSQAVEATSPADQALQAVGLVLDPVVLRFLEAFKEAVCGDPGSAVLDLLEEVVVCEIDCADENNVFCPA